MDVYYALPQSVYQLYSVYILQNDRGNNSIWVFVPPIPCHNSIPVMCISYLP